MGLSQTENVGPQGGDSPGSPWRKREKPLTVGVARERGEEDIFADVGLLTSFNMSHRHRESVLKADLRYFSS